VPRAAIPEESFPEHAHIERVSEVRPVLFEPGTVRATHNPVGMRRRPSAGDGTRVLRKA